MKANDHSNKTKSENIEENFKKIVNVPIIENKIVQKSNIIGTKDVYSNIPVN